MSCMVFYFLVGYIWDSQFTNYLHDLSIFIGVIKLFYKPKSAE